MSRVCKDTSARGLRLRGHYLMVDRSRLGKGLALSLLAVLVGCGQQDLPPPSPPAVTVTQPVQSDVREYGIFTGIARAVESVEIRARVAGTLEKVSFEPSQLVKTGDMLFVIEREQYQAARDEALAYLKSAEAELARAESDLQRLQRAVATSAVSESDVDLAQAKRDQAEAAVLGAEARLRNAERDLAYSLVRSPITGQVSRNFVDVGNLVGHGEPTLLTTVNQIDSMYVYFDAPEALVLRLLDWMQEEEAAGDHTSRRIEAFVSLADEEGFPHRGEIDYIDNTVNPTTGTIEIRAVVPNSEFILFPGLFVRVKVIGRLRPDAILVDEKAVGTDLGGKYVYILSEGNVVEQRFIQLGAVQPDGMIVVEEGLDGSEIYIINGMLRARPGLPVAPQTAAES